MDQYLNSLTVDKVQEIVTRQREEIKDKIDKDAYEHNYSPEEYKDILSNYKELMSSPLKNHLLCIIDDFHAGKCDLHQTIEKIKIIVALHELWKGGV